MAGTFDTSELTRNIRKVILRALKGNRVQILERREEVFLKI